MITGPMKFSFMTGKIKREAMAFWCVMMPRSLFDEIGLLDEIFSPGTGEDGDFCIKAAMKGHQLVQVPIDIGHEFGKGKQAIQNFPIYHKGSGTFETMEAKALIEKNTQILNERYGMTKKYSIVIPTYNRCNELLKPCLESIFKYTDMSQVQIIVVANGCTDNTKEYLSEFPSNLVQFLWYDEALGYTKATNEGIRVATGEYVILLNNDTILLDQRKNQWIELLEAPFAKKEVGLTGPLMLHDDYANYPVLIFFCVMIKREVFDKIGLLDEIFSPGGGEDIDFTIRAEKAGYVAQICEGGIKGNKKTPNVGYFPIWHAENKTFVHMPEYTNSIVKVNGLLNCRRYNKNIKLNLGSGGVEVPGYLSVDLFDNRANILMDVTRLDFDDNSVTEILASHIFEHLNPYHCADILTNWLRVLKPGGKLIMEMPNIEMLCERFGTASKSEKYGILNAIYGSVNTTGVGGPDNITSPHLFGWWPESLWDILNGVGFSNVVFMPEQIPHPESNLRVEATKPIIDRLRLKQQEPLVYKEIFEQNVYELIDSQVRGKTVIDVGANVGLFTLRCLELGAKKILAVEAQPTIFKWGLIPNMSPYYNVKVLNRAVLDSDGKIVHIPNNHVGSQVGPEGEEVTTVSLQTLVDLADDDDMVLKLDCEGSEYDILFSSSKETLRRFGMIHIEIHTEINTSPYASGLEPIHNQLQNYGFEIVSLKQVENKPIYDEKWMKV